MNTLKIVCVLISLAVATSAFSQPDTHTKGETFLEVGLLPLFFYNNASLGVSINPSMRSEHVISAQLRLAHTVSLMGSYGITYSYNMTVRQFENTNLYIPFWIRLRRATRQSTGWFSGEEGGYINDAVLSSAGFGIGCRVRFIKRSSLRLETGIGAMNITNVRVSGFENKQSFPHPFLDQSSEKTNGVIPTIRLNIKFLLPL